MHAAEITTMPSDAAPGKAGLPLAVGAALLDGLVGLASGGSCYDAPQVGKSRLRMQGGWIEFLLSALRLVLLLVEE